MILRFLGAVFMLTGAYTLGALRVHGWGAEHCWAWLRGGQWFIGGRPCPGCGRRRHVLRPGPAGMSLCGGCSVLAAPHSGPWWPFPAGEGCAEDASQAARSRTESDGHGAAGAPVRASGSGGVSEPFETSDNGRTNGNAT